MTAQRIAPLSVAEEMLPAASRNRGLMMDRTSAPGGPNMFDGGPMSEPNSNAQPFNNMMRQEQSIRENTKSAMTQAGADAIQGVRKNVQGMSQQEFDAQVFAATRTAELLDASDGGRALMQLNSVMQSPERQSMINGLATSRAMAAGANPDLGAEAANSMMYG